MLHLNFQLTLPGYLRPLPKGTGNEDDPGRPPYNRDHSHRRDRHEPIPCQGCHGYRGKAYPGR